jgi:hypothetical protein
MAWKWLKSRGTVIVYIETRLAKKYDEKLINQTKDIKIVKLCIICFFGAKCEMYNFLL